MKKILVVALACGLGFASLPSHAISHAFRAKLERSGCTQVTEANGTCNPNKTKAQNQAHKGDHLTPAPVRQRPTTALDHAASEAETAINCPIGEAADFLLANGWKPNNGAWFKGGHELHLLVENGTVVNAQLVK